MKEFKHTYKFKNAIVYSNSKLKDWEFRNEMEEIEESELEKFSISKWTKIGFLDYNDSLSGIIVFTNNSFFYGYEDCMTTDGVNYFELEEGVHFVPAQEPVDAIESGYEGGGGCELENADELREIVKKYKLNHLLISV